MLKSQISNFLRRSAFPILSGLFAFLAGFAGKHAFSEDIGGYKNYDIIKSHEYISYVLRAIFAVLMLYFNSLMLKFFIRSLQESGATITTVMNFSFNFILSGISSFIYFNEPFKINWLFGVSLILCGVIILSNNKDRKDAAKSTQRKDSKNQ